MIERERRLSVEQRKRKRERKGCFEPQSHWKTMEKEKEKERMEELREAR